jgi:Na+/melibiose symporter-like transporter
VEFITRLKQASRQLALFATASLAMGMAYSIFDATFNNFLNDNFSLTGFQRSFLEFPRELPGVLVVFVSALLWFLCSRRLGAWSLVLGAIGAVLIGFFSSSYALMIVWLFIYSMGQHIFIPISTTIGMDLAREGQSGRRLGQLNAIRNLATNFRQFPGIPGVQIPGVHLPDHLHHFSDKPGGSGNPDVFHDPRKDNFA